MWFKFLKLFWSEIEVCVRTIIFRQNYFSNFTILINFYIGWWLVVWFGRGSYCGHALNQWLTTSIERLYHFEPYGLTAVGPLFTSCPSIFPNKLSSVNDIPSSHQLGNINLETSTWEHYSETPLRNITSKHHFEIKQRNFFITLFLTDWCFQLVFPIDSNIFFCSGHPVKPF